MCHLKSHPTPPPSSVLLLQIVFCILDFCKREEKVQLNVFNDRTRRFVRACHTYVHSFLYW